MQGYSFAPPSGPSKEGHKSKHTSIYDKLLPHWGLESKRVLTENTRVLDYVFVDEHNRHKRLKGMRSLRELHWWAWI